MLRRIDIEGLAGEAEDLIGEGLNLSVHTLGDRGQLGGFDANAESLHAGQDWREREVNLVIDAAEVACDFGAEARGERLEGLLFGGARALQIAGDEGAEGAGGRIGQDKEGVEKDVLDGLLRHGATVGEMGFQIKDDGGVGRGLPLAGRCGGLNNGFSRSEPKFLEEAEELQLAIDFG